MQDARLSSPGCWQAAAVEMQVASEVNGVVGDDATLRCTFTSSSPVTARLSVDWTYQPLEGQASHSFFYYQSKAFLQTEGLFKGRVSWQGDVNRGDASIQLRNLTLNDNGTFTCTVRNPPDVHGNLAKTVLTVTPRGNPIRITEFILLSGLVLLPSILIVSVLLVRMGCSNGILGRRKTHVCKRSPIEASDGYVLASACSV
ncbi:MPZL3 protein, partial [Polyodon spathula]|nr:MPZL3 protein [Polyodon spathula]